MPWHSPAAGCRHRRHSRRLRQCSSARFGRAVKAVRRRRRHGSRLAAKPGLSHATRVVPGARGGHRRLGDSGRPHGAPRPGDRCTHRALPPPPGMVSRVEQHRTPPRPRGICAWGLCSASDSSRTNSGLQLHSSRHSTPVCACTHAHMCTCALCLFSHVGAHSCLGCACVRMRARVRACACASFCPRVSLRAAFAGSRVTAHTPSGTVSRSSHQPALCPSLPFPPRSRRARFCVRTAGARRSAVK
jgi:hypothetical protein